MILKNIFSVRFFMPLLIVSGLSAAPRLSLVQTSLTISVASGTNGPAYSLDTFNIGDGTLHLTASSSVPWLVPTVGASQLCGLRGGCSPLSIAFQTAALAAGTYTGVITLTDPNAVDTPQSITVTAQVGGDVPSNLVFYLAPGASTSATFTTNGPLVAKVNNTTWLTTSTSPNAGTGAYVTTLTAAAGSSMTAADYNGTITISGSNFSPDNKSISVLLHVTTQPIAQVSSNAVSFNLAEGTKAQSMPVGVMNAGKGTLTVSGVTATAASGTWLSAATVNGGISITADPTGLSPSTYTGTVTIASNGVNGNIVIPVEFTVKAQGPPVAYAGGVVNNGTFATGEPLAQGDVAALKGNQLLFDVQQFAPSVPLPTTLDGVQVLVNGKAAPIYSITPLAQFDQIDFEIPIDAALGDGTVQVIRNGTAGNLVYVDINARAPRFLPYLGAYAIMTTPAGVLTGIPSSPAKVGDTIVIYAIGLGPTSPSVPSGTASPTTPLAEVPGVTKVCFGIETPFYQAPCATPQFSGLTPNLVGLYQINVTIPSGIASGNNTMTLIQVDNISSTSVQLAVQ